MGKVNQMNKIIKKNEFSTLMSSFSKKNTYFFMKYFLEVRSIPILPFPLLFSSSGRLGQVPHLLEFVDPSGITMFITRYTVHGRGANSEAQVFKNGIITFKRQ